MEIAAAHGLLRGLLIVPVAEHDVRPLDEELAGLAVGHIVAVGIDDAPVDVFYDRADRADLGMAGRVHRHDRTRFRETVAFADIDAEFLHEILLDLERQRRAAADDEAQRMHVLLRRELRKEAADRRNYVEIVDALAADGADRFLRRELIEDDDSCAAVERINR